MFIVIFWDANVEYLDYARFSTYEEAKKFRNEFLKEFVFNQAEIINIKEELSLERN